MYLILESGSSIRTTPVINLMRLVSTPVEKSVGLCGLLYRRRCISALLYGCQCKRTPHLVIRLQQREQASSAVKVQYTQTNPTSPTLTPSPPKPSPTPPPKLPTPPPSPPPTPTPVPAQASGVNGNPWGYNFTPGNVIYSPPGAFCIYFSCIGNFLVWTWLC